MLTLPYAYRDSRADDGYKRAFAVAKKEEIFAETGIQFMRLNTLYQLHADVKSRPWILKTANRFLRIGDYVNDLFSGKEVVEQSFASTTQLYNPRTRKWSAKLQKKLGIPARLFSKIVKAGTVLGSLLAADKRSLFQPARSPCPRETVRKQRFHGGEADRAPAGGQDRRTMAGGSRGMP